MASQDSPYLTILRNYAQKVDPSKLPPDVLFEYTDTSITVFDAYPKSDFHFLILPRPRMPFEIEDLDSLRTLLKCNKEDARQLLVGLGEDAKKLRAAIEQEMIDRWGFKWEIWTGFHAKPSMSHLHLHVLSADLCSPALKHKKHYNSFHPEIGFFVSYDEVMSWFEAEESFWKQKSALRPSNYESLLKEPLQCFRCNEEFKNMPLLKAHLKSEFDTMKVRERAKMETKRKLLAAKAKREKAQEAAAESKDGDGSPVRKKARTEES